MAAFVEATKKIVEEEGIEAASIRRISTTAGYSSATLYLYFEDMNELITMSLISHLTDYVRDIIDSTPPNETPEETYCRTWELFCLHAFAYPTAFLNLFYGPQSNHLDAIAIKYYELFPDQLENASKLMFEMLERGSLTERNKVILISFADKMGLTEHETNLANEMTIAYFRSFLQEACEQEFSQEDIEDHVNRFMEGALFVLRKKAS
jgi:AcrR family transcriptional regulator